MSQSQGNKHEDLRAFITRLFSSSDPIHEKDVKKIKEMTKAMIQRPNIRHLFSFHTPTSLKDFLKQGRYGRREGTREPFDAYESIEIGLKKQGYLVDKEPFLLREGSFGRVELVMPKNQVKIKPPYARRFAALKTITIDNQSYKYAFNDVSVMKSMRHPNVVDYIGEFVVEPAKQPPDAPVNMRPIYTFCIIMEFTNAGTMATEINRYKDKYIPPDGARYYIKQVIAGLKALHRRKICHNDLHIHNVLLNYLGDGRHKSCKIADFGNAVFSNEYGINQEAQKRDCLSVYEIFMTMMCGISSDGLTFRDPATRPHMTPKLIKQMDHLKEIETIDESDDLSIIYLPWQLPDPGTSESQAAAEAAAGGQSSQQFAVPSTSTQQRGPSATATRSSSPEAGPSTPKRLSSVVKRVQREGTPMREASTSRTRARDFSSDSDWGSDPESESKKMRTSSGSYAPRLSSATSSRPPSPSSDMSDMSFASAGSESESESSGSSSSSGRPKKITKRRPVAEESSDSE